jgi:anti-sigma B factor antagonist
MPQQAQALRHPSGREVFAWREPVIRERELKSKRRFGEDPAMDTNGTFQIEYVGDTLVLSPLINLGELEYERIERDGQSVLDRIATAHCRNVVVDFSQTEYYGSTALGFFLRLWSRLRVQGGHMAFCNVSPVEREILQVTRLDTLWSICATREEALAVVGGTARRRVSVT